MTFSDYVAGKTIAVVGPAPIPVDQSAEIDAHDLVYRVAGSVDLAGHYGTRCDIVYLNGALGRSILDDDHEHLRRHMDPATWWVYKAKHNRAYRPSGLERIAARPPIQNPNAVTGILWDLTAFDPASITVYGADLYAGGPGNAYYSDYDRRDVGGQAQGIILHKPLEQMAIHRQVYATGIIKGDDRYVAAVNMSDEDYKAVIDRWQDVYQTYQAAQAALT